MHFDIGPHTIYLAKTGSHAYGTNIEGSDLDLRGVAVSPRQYVCGFAYNFEQHEQKGALDKVVYDLRKFMQHAMLCNPNFLETLFVDEADIIEMTEEGKMLREHRDLFLSKKARHAFSGYAISQLKRIRSHRGYLLNPPTHKPTREEFGLSTTSKITADMMGAFDKLIDGGHEIHPNVMQLVQAEKQYKSAMDAWNSYQNWKTKRNESRADLEAQFGYDTKHAMHLVRLLRMCGEILTGKGLIVKRPDAEELLGIRRGDWDYEKLVTWAEQQDSAMQELYESSTLPHAPDPQKLNDLCVELHERFWVRAASRAF